MFVKGIFYKNIVIKDSNVKRQGMPIKNENGKQNDRTGQQIAIENTVFSFRHSMIQIIN